MTLGNFNQDAGHRNYLAWRQKTAKKYEARAAFYNDFVPTIIEYALFLDSGAVSFVLERISIARDLFDCSIWVDVRLSLPTLRFRNRGNLGRRASQKEDCLSMTRSMGTVNDR